MKMDVSRQLSGMGITLDSHNMYVFDLLRNVTADEITVPNVELTDALKSAVSQLAADMDEVKGTVGSISASISYLADEFEELFRDFSFEGLLKILKKMVGVIAVDFLSISKILIKTMFDIITEGIKTLWAAVTMPLRIPFLSEILKLFGVGEFCILDLFTYPTAFLANAVNSGIKLFGGAGMFDMSDIKEVENIKSLDEIK